MKGRAAGKNKNNAHSKKVKKQGNKVNAAKTSHKKAQAKTKIGVEARKKAKELEKEKLERQQKKEQARKVLEAINTVLANDAFVEYIHTNVGRYGVEVMKRLTVPKTDDALANELSVKVNEVRRVLNLLSGYGITKYDTEKDSKGWLTFHWYVDADKLLEFNNNISAKKEEVLIGLPEDCDDFFVCEKCFDYNKVVLPFDVAFEHSFKCPDCGKPLKRLSKEEAKSLLLEKEKVI
ncbi:MAG: hypothetical protein ACP5GD_00455 [Candidatus Micrarchaeia archaeon]